MTNATHPDDEVLSALLDGAAAGEKDENEKATASHLAGCLRCQERLAGFRRVSAALAHPVRPPDPAVRENDLKLALRVGKPPQTALLAAPDRRRRVRRERPKRREPAEAFGWLAAAAALVAVLVGVPLLLSSRHNGQSAAKSAAATTGLPSAPPPAGRGGLAAGGTQTNPGTGGPSAAYGANVPPMRPAMPFIGSWSDPVALSAQLNATLNNSSSRQEGVAPPATTAPVSESVDNAAAQQAACEASAAQQVSATPGATLVYAAQLTWRGTAAQVFVFTSSAGRKAGVMGVSGCRLLQALTL